MEDTQQKLEQVYQQRLVTFTQELENVEQTLKAKDGVVEELKKKLTVLEKEKSQIQKENRVLNTEIGAWCI